MILISLFIYKTEFIEFKKAHNLTGETKNYVKNKTL